MKEETCSVLISKKLFNKIQERLKNSDNEFSTVDSYIEYVLAELLDDDVSPYTKQEEEEVEKHLKDMGYI